LLQVPPERPMTQQPVRLDVIIGEFTPRLDQPRAVSIGYHLEGTQPRSANRSRLEGTRPKSSPRASRPEGTQPKSEPASAPRGPHKRKQRDTGAGSTRKMPRRGQRSPRPEPEAPGSSRRMCLGILVGGAAPRARARGPEHLSAPPVAAPRASLCAAGHVPRHVGGWRWPVAAPKARARGPEHLSAPPVAAP